jgi:hypothetical protein
MSDKTKTATVDRSRKAWTHFGVVAGLLGIFAIGINPLFDAPLLQLVGWVLQKSPVPWPEGVTVDSTTMRNTSLALKMGPYERVEEDGLLQYEPAKDEQGKIILNSDGSTRMEPVKDGEPDGEHIFDDELLESLKINTSLDEMRHPDRTSNWYVSRRYVDTRPGKQHRLWGLDLYYYTGSADQVAHVPEICGAAGGGTPLPPEEIPVQGKNLPEGWSHWQNFEIRRIAIESPSQHGQTRRSQQYYVFCTNGQPGVDRLSDVRARLADPTKEYVYFLKVQWYPLRAGRSPEITDQEATEFIETVLPEVLTQVPTVATLEKLEAAD